jgi:hypothetical protein
MPKKTKAKSDSRNKKDELWIAPRLNLRGPDGRAWDERSGGTPNGSRFLEYADIALGLKKTEPRKRDCLLAARMTLQRPTPTPK